MRGGYSVQVAAVPTKDEADRLVTRLVGQGYPAYAIRGEGAAANLYRVRVGGYPDRAAAQEVAKRLEGTEGFKPWIAKETPQVGAASQTGRRDEGSNRR